MLSPRFLRAKDLPVQFLLGACDKRSVRRLRSFAGAQDDVRITFGEEGRLAARIACHESLFACDGKPYLTAQTSFGMTVILSALGFVHGCAEKYRLQPGRYLLCCFFRGDDGIYLEINDVVPVRHPFFD